MHQWIVRTTDGEETTVEADRVELNPTTEAVGISVVSPFVVFRSEGDDQPVAAFPTDRVLGVRRVVDKPAAV